MTAGGLKAPYESLTHRKAFLVRLRVRCHPLCAETALHSFPIRGPPGYGFVALRPQREERHRPVCVTREESP